jgi:hypothetical protein
MFPFFVRFGLRPEGTMTGWVLGATIAMLALGTSGAWGGVASLTTPGVPFLCAMVVGGTLSVTANVLLAQAAVTAPNPALPFALNPLANIVTYLLAIVAWQILPNLFRQPSFSIPQVVGLALIVVGSVIAVSK